MNLWTQEGKEEGGMNWEISTDIYILLPCANRQREAAVSHKEFISELCDELEGEREAQEEGGYMYHSFIQLLSCVQLFLIPWTVVHQAPPSMGFPRQEYCNGLSFPSPGDLPNPGIKSESPALVGRFFITEPPRKPRYMYTYSWFTFCTAETNTTL